MKVCDVCFASPGKASIEMHEDEPIIEVQISTVGPRYNVRTIHVCKFHAEISFLGLPKVYDLYEMAEKMEKEERRK